MDWQIDISLNHSGTGKDHVSYDYLNQSINY